MKEKSKTAKTPVSERVRAVLVRQAMDNTLTCARAIGLAEQLGAEALEIGQGMDELGQKITCCQLGLFGWGEQKQDRDEDRVTIATDWEAAIIAACVDRKLSCASAWALAEQLCTTREAIAQACDALGVRINACQLGAF